MAQHPIPIALTWIPLLPNCLLNIEHPQVYGLRRCLHHSILASMARKCCVTVVAAQSVRAQPGEFCRLPDCEVVAIVHNAIHYTT
jgi:hypothetical protein